MDNNITITEEPLLTENNTDNAEQNKQIILTDIDITNGNVAFNVIVSFLTVAQKRGTFSINESAKIWECLKFFLTPEQLNSQPAP
jgi:hypothetical protein